MEIADKEKVIKGLEICNELDCSGCPYGTEGHGHNDCIERLCADALALVKELESTLNRLRSTMEDIKELLDEECFDGYTDTENVKRVLREVLELLNVR